MIHGNGNKSFTATVLRTLSVLLVVSTSMACGNKQVNRDKATLHYDIAYDLLQKGELGPAIEQIDKAVRLEPKNPEFRNLYGLIYASSGHLDKAEAELREALRLRPNYADVYNNLCGLNISRSQWDQAIEHCEKAVSIITYASPEKAYHNMGWAYYKKGDMMNAIQSYKKALRYRENFYIAHQNLGMVYFDLKKYNLAIDNFQAAIKGCNFCPEPYYRLGLALFKVDKKKTALKSFNKCRELDKEGEIGKLCGNFVKKYQR